MSEQNLTAPEAAKIRWRVKTVEEEEILVTTASSVEVVDSPKRRKVEYAAEESAKHNCCSSSPTSPRKRLFPCDKNDSSGVDTRLRPFGSGSVVHAPSSNGCSEEESSSGFFKHIEDPAEDWLKSDTSSHSDASVVVSSPESEVCSDLPGKDMESKSSSNTEIRSVVFKTPMAAEIEEFFLAAEKLEAKRFKDRYNFDIENDVPVKGRFEWSQVKH